MKILTRILVFSAVLLPIVTYAGCPPFDPAALWLPKEKAYAKAVFQRKAKNLNDFGQCVVEGGYGRSYDKFYITVSPTGAPSKDAKILRFTYDELNK